MADIGRKVDIEPQHQQRPLLGRKQPPVESLLLIQKAPHLR